MKRIILFIFMLVMLSSFPALAQTATPSNSYLIYTWDYQDIMVSMLHAVKYFMGTQSFGTLLKIAMLLSVFTVFLSLISDKGFSPVLIFQKVLLVIGLQTLLISSPVDVIVKDVSAGSFSNLGGVSQELVDDVPAIIGFPIYVLSNIEYTVRNVLRNSLNHGALQNGVLSLDELSVVTGLNLLQSTSSIKVNDVSFNKSFRSFVENCVLPDIYSGYIDVSQITQNPNFWNYLGQDLHHARIGNYYSRNNVGNNQSNPDGEIMTCNNLYTAINNDINTVSVEAKAKLQASLGLSANFNLDNAIGALSSVILDYQTAGGDLLTNAMMINTFNDSYQSIASGMGINTTGLAYSMAKAQETARMNASMQGIMAKKYMPMAKGYLTVIFVAIIPLIIIIALITSSFRKPFAMIFGLLLALALWNIGDQILDFIILVRVKSLFELSNIAASGYTMETQPFIDSAITDTLSLSLGMYWMIPTLAFSVATLSGYGAASMMNGIAGIATAGASSAAAEAAGGNMSFGNVRANAVNMNKYDATQAWSGGLSSRLTMDTQHTASNQNSVRTGTENSLRDIDENFHKGSTWITDTQTGKTYEVNGVFDQTSGGWSGVGNIREYDKNGNYIGSYKGEIEGTGNMADYQRNVVQGGQGGKENAFKATSVVSTNLDASNIKHEDNVNTKNTVDEQNSRYTRTNDVDYSSSYKNNVVYEQKNVDDTRNTNLSGSETIGGNKTTIDNSTTSIDGNQSTHLGNGINWTNTLQTMMEKNGLDKQNTVWIAELMDMKDKVNAGEMSKEEYGSHLLKFGTQLSSDLRSVINETGINSLSSSLSAYAKVGFEIAGNGAGGQYGNSVSGQINSQQDNVALGLVGMLDQNIDKFRGYVQGGIAENNLRAATGVVIDTQKELTRLMNTDLTTSTAEVMQKGVEKITK